MAIQCAGDGRCAGAAVGLENIAVDEQGESAARAFELF